jgi:hypothetical protein
MEHLWAPVGTGVRPQSETDFVVTYLFGDDEGREPLLEMRATMAELPGLGDSRFFVDAVEAARFGTERRFTVRPALLQTSSPSAQAVLGSS